MANEALLRLRIEDPLPFTVADGTGIEKGTVLKNTDPRTAVADPNTVNFVVAGILAREKVADDGRTEMAVFRRGWFDMVASGAITVGDPVVHAGGNTVDVATVTSSGANVIGHALETATADERILVDVDVTGGWSYG